MRVVVNLTEIERALDHYLETGRMKIETKNRVMDMLRQAVQETLPAIPEIAMNNFICYKSGHQYEIVYTNDDDETVVHRRLKANNGGPANELLTTNKRNVQRKLDKGEAVLLSRKEFEGSLKDDVIRTRFLSVGVKIDRPRSVQLGGTLRPFDLGDPLQPYLFGDND